MCNKLWFTVYTPDTGLLLQALHVSYADPYPLHYQADVYIQKRLCYWNRSRTPDSNLKYSVDIVNIRNDCFLDLYVFIFAVPVVPQLR